MLEFLPDRYLNAIGHIDRGRLFELRVRANKPLSANVGGEYVFLGERGVCPPRRALVPTQEEVEGILFAASGYSVHAVENQLRQGFVTASAGERVGIAGEFVYEGERVLSVHSVTSLCIRVPHEVSGCGEEIYARTLEDGLRSLLLLSPPALGKTTLLRDLCRLICLRKGCNVLVCDERGELSAGDLGATADCMKCAGKLTAFTAGIRAMRPDVIVTDELLPEDYAAVRRAAEGGICVLASAHLTSFAQVPEKLFSRYVLLDGLGKVGKVLDERGEPCA